MTSRRIVVDGDPVLLCGVGPGFSKADAEAMAEIVRAAQRRFAEQRAIDETTPDGRERIARSDHHQRGRADGSWGCACGWAQDKPHSEHVADMVEAARAGEPS